MIIMMGYEPWTMGKYAKEGCEDMGVIRHRGKALGSMICTGVQKSLDVDNYGEQATQIEGVAVRGVVDLLHGLNYFHILITPNLYLQPESLLRTLDWYI